MPQILNSKKVNKKESTNFAVHQSLSPLVRYLFLWLLLLMVACNNQKQQNKVVGISDGDSFTLLTADKQQVKVRLYGIDTPEKAQDFGTVARQKLSDLIFGKTVTLDEKDKDRYGRTVAIVYTKEGLCVNEAMLQSGLAWHYRQYDKNEDWSAMEANAREQKLGLWAAQNPTPPWLYRKEKREAAK